MSTTIIVNCSLKIAGEIINEDLHHDKTIKDGKKSKAIKEMTAEAWNFKMTRLQKKKEEMTRLQKKKEEMTRLQNKKEEINVDKVSRQAAEYLEYHNTYEKKIRENLKTVEVLLYKY